MKKIMEFFKNVKKEMKKVKWPSKKDMVKYSLATIIFIIFFGLFFYSLELLFVFIKELVK